MLEKNEGNALKNKFMAVAAIKGFAFDFSIIKSLSQGDYAILGFDWSFTDSAMEEYS